MKVESIGSASIEEETKLFEKWDEELPCEHPGHEFDFKRHDAGVAASVRGTAPCGRTLNICAKFAVVIANRKIVLCMRGHVHLGSNYTFIEI